jgi:hypothetical protein
LNTKPTDVSALSAMEGLNMGQRMFAAFDASLGGKACPAARHLL